MSKLVWDMFYLSVKYDLYCPDMMQMGNVVIVSFILYC